MRRTAAFARRSMVLSCVALVAAAVASCSRGGDSRTSIVLITVDTLRADRLTPYGYGGIQTPTIQSLADSGIVFENAFCNVTWTTPSMASVMTGLYDFEHGVQTTWDRLEGASPTLAELMRQHGYYTAAIVASFPLDRRFGFGRGFVTYSDDTSTPLYAPASAARPVDESLFSQDPGRWYQERAERSAFRPDGVVVDEALAWLNRGPASPFFLWVHLFGPHARGSGRRTSATYDEDVHSTDRELGRLLSGLKEMPTWKQTALIFHSDHGETLREHPAKGHGGNLHDSSARIPLVIRLPGDRRAGERVDRLVRNVDVFPTVLHLAGITPPAETRGRDLLGSAPEKPETVYLASYFVPFRGTVMIEGKATEVRFRLCGVRTADWKLVVTEPVSATRWSLGEEVELPASFVEARRKVELYDLRADPAERVDVAAKRPEKVRELMALLERTEASGTHAHAPRRALDPQAREKLEKLGYVE